MPLPLPTYFQDFLKQIRPSAPQRADMAKGHRILRENLQADKELAEGFVGMFLQGSYMRYTAVRPKDGKKADVDLVVVTCMKEAEFTPDKAMNCFEPFLKRHYAGKYRRQGRSFGIVLSYVELDLVITAAPSEAQAGLYSNLYKAEAALRLDEDEAPPLVESGGQQVPLWKTEPLRIPDRDLGRWQDTDPLTQLRWTSQKNARTSGHYGNVVKALKWWRLINASTLPDRPKSYPLEHLIGDCCPDGITSVAEGVVKTLEEFTRCYAFDASRRRTPYSEDRGVAQNVMARIDGNDFAAFHTQAALAATVARSAFEAQDPQTAAPLWRKLFGSLFPEAPEGGGGSSSQGGFSPHQGGPGRVSEGRFARE
jgi:hypothetical protein